MINIYVQICFFWKNLEIWKWNFFECFSILLSKVVDWFNVFSLLQHFIDMALIKCHDRLPGFLQLLVWFHVIHVPLFVLVLKSEWIFLFQIEWSFFLDWRPLSRLKNLSSLSCLPQSGKDENIEMCQVACLSQSKMELNSSFLLL